MKKVFLMVAIATLAWTGIVSAEEMVVKGGRDMVADKAAAPVVEAAAPVVEKAAAPAVEAAAPVVEKTVALAVDEASLAAEQKGPGGVPVPDINKVAAVAEQKAAEPVKLNNTVCPVCGMEIPADLLGKETVEVKGKIINVCSAMDKETLLTEPDKFLQMTEESMVKAPAAPVAAPEAAAPAAEEKK